MHKKQGMIGIKDGIYFIIALLAIILALAYWYLTAPPPRFCVAQNRFIPEEEFVKSSVNGKQYKQKIVNGRPSALNCCSITKIEGDFWSKVFRMDEGVAIGWDYERSKDAETNPEDKYHSVGSVLDSCKTKEKSTFGQETLNTLPTHNKNSSYSKYDNY